MESGKGCIGIGFVYQTVALVLVTGSPVLFLVLLQSIVLLWVPLVTMGFGMYLFALGIRHQMNSRASPAVRMALVLWPAAIYLGVLGFYAVVEKWVPGEDKIIAALQWRLARTEIFLIPADFRGKVTVTLDDPNGVPPQKEGNNVVFEIPSSGQLSTREHAGYANGAVFRAIEERRQFYLVDKSSGRTRIPLSEPGQPPGQLVVSWEPFGSVADIPGFLEDGYYRFYSFRVLTDEQGDSVR